MYRLVDSHYAADTEARPGALEFVKRLKARGMKVAVATATPLRYANTAMKRLGFEGLFDLVVSDEDFAEAQPAPPPRNQIVTCDRFRCG